MKKVELRLRDEAGRVLLDWHEATDVCVVRTTNEHYAFRFTGERIYKAKKDRPAQVYRLDVRKDGEVVQLKPGDPLVVSKGGTIQPVYILSTPDADPEKLVAMLTGGES